MQDLHPFSPTPQTLFLFLRNIISQNNSFFFQLFTSFLHLQKKQLLFSFSSLVNDDFHFSQFFKSKICSFKYQLFLFFQRQEDSLILTSISQTVIAVGEPDRLRQKQ